MKLNNRGFAISTLLYGLLAILILILMVTFKVMRSNNNNSKEMSDSVTTNLSTCRNERVNYQMCTENCDILRSTYEDCMNN